jgi:hypothetical protein
MKDIKSIIPIDYYELIIEFENSEFKCFSPEKLKLYEKRDFLAYPNKLKSFKYDQNQIIWYNNFHLDKKYLYQNSILLEQDQLERNGLSISSKNHAPTDKHPSHHVYYFMIYPFKNEKQFVIGESIGGGHGEMGGCASFDLKEILESPELINHLTLSNCSWVYEIMKANSFDTKDVINKLVLEVCIRSNPL